MKVKLDDLRKAVSIVTGAVKTSLDSSMDILKYVRFKGSKGSLELFLTNRVSSVNTSIPAEDCEKVDYCFPIKQLHTILNLPVTHLEILEDNLKGIINTGVSKIKIPLLSSENYPNYGSIENFLSEEIRVTMGLLRKSLEISSISVGQKNFGQMINEAVSITPQKESTLFLACDGSQISLAKTSTKLLSKKHIGNQYLLPGQSIPGIIHFLKNESDDSLIDIKFTEKAVVITNSVGVLHLVLLTGKFPDVKKALSFESDVKFSINSENICDIIKRVLGFSADNIITIDITKSYVNLSASNRNLGEIKETVQIDGDIKEPLRFGLNGRSLIEYLNKLDGDVEVKTSVDKRYPVYFSQTTDNLRILFLNMKTIVS